ncbi:hypothetical protein RIF29_22565 [Crotalaria pallida]|uniref:Ubiquitin-like domain-containing protein n=1 Tax=Crotalaria pallida TaxID=3830 RepID=A0AAN9I6Z0_CROPI
MDPDTEEFDPLFDYSRTLPNQLLCLDDDDEDEDVFCGAKKKRKTSKNVGDEKKKKKTDVKGVQVVDLEDSDDDWLPPPPKVSCDAKKLTEEDSTLKKLRLKKQELVSLAESAKKMLKTVEETAKIEISNSLQSSEDGICEETSKPAERAKILISVQDKSETKQIRMFVDDKFERIVKSYADKMKCDLKQIVLAFDGDKISSSDTPASLGMEENDIIEVHVKSN